MQEINKNCPNCGEVKATAVSDSYFTNCETVIVSWWVRCPYCNHYFANDYEEIEIIYEE